MRTLREQTASDSQVARWNLWQLRGVSHRHIEALESRGSLEQLWNLDRTSLEHRLDDPDPGPKTRERLLRHLLEGPDPREAYRREIDSLPERAELLHISESRYPNRLLDLSDPPTCLYVWGEPAALEDRPTLATVGTRQVGIEGARRASTIVRDVVDSGIAIVSGGANGVDTVAHETCLECDVPTVAFMPGGLDQCTPRSNADLFEAISHRGALMTEYPMGVEVRRYHFPRRNRLIAALGDATFVVRGDLDSGTMLTAEAAIDLDRRGGCPGCTRWSRHSRLPHGRLTRDSSLHGVRRLVLSSILRIDVVPSCIRPFSSSRRPVGIDMPTGRDGARATRRRSRATPPCRSVDEGRGPGSRGRPVLAAGARDVRARLEGAGCAGVSISSLRGVRFPLTSSRRTRLDHVSSILQAFEENSRRLPRPLCRSAQRRFGTMPLDRTLSAALIRPQRH